MILYISSACPSGNGKEKMCKEYRFILGGMPNYDFVIILVVWGGGMYAKIWRFMTTQKWWCIYKYCPPIFMIVIN